MSPYPPNGHFTPEPADFSTPPTIIFVSIAFRDSTATSDAGYRLPHTTPPVQLQSARLSKFAASFNVCRRPHSSMHGNISRVAAQIWASVHGALSIGRSVAPSTKAISASTPNSPNLLAESPAGVSTSPHPNSRPYTASVSGTAPMPPCLYPTTPPSFSASGSAADALCML